MSIVLVLLAAVVASAVGALAARRHGVPGAATIAVLLDSALIGLLAARAGFVLAWWPLYLDDPWSVFRISDGGFSLWPGLIAAAGYIAWRTRGSVAMRRPLAIALVSGLLVWTLLDRSLVMLQRHRLDVPEVELMRLDGGAVMLPALSDEPMVINLWATWCPPCRREMPVMAAAQEQYPNVTFAFVNQGEGRARIEQYLRSEGLALDNVLLDVARVVGPAVGSRVLPTTLFFDAGGRLVDTHIGALTQASLAAALQRFAPSGSDTRYPMQTESPDANQTFSAVPGAVSAGDRRLHSGR